MCRHVFAFFSTSQQIKKKREQKRGIRLSLAHIPTLTFVTHDGVRGLPTWPLKPLSLTLFCSCAPIPLCACMRECLHWHPAFWFCCSLTLCRDEEYQTWDVASSAYLLFKSTIRAMHCRFLLGLVCFVGPNQNDLAQLILWWKAGSPLWAFKLTHQ